MEQRVGMNVSNSVNMEQHTNKQKLITMLSTMEQNRPRYQTTKMVSQPLVCDHLCYMSMLTVSAVSVGPHVFCVAAITGSLHMEVHEAVLLGCEAQVGGALSALHFHYTRTAGVSAPALFLPPHRPVISVVMTHSC